MRLLLIDTSGPVCGVAVTDEDRVLYEAVTQNRNTHSTNLMPMVEEAFRSAGVKPEEIDAIAAVVGPGSFTGVRIGVATAKGLAHGSGKPCIAVDALEALSRSVEPGNMAVCPIQDARAGQVYGAAFYRGERLMQDEALKIGLFLDKVTGLIPPEAEGLLFTGDGVPVCREFIQERMGEKARFAPPAFCFLRPAAAALLAAEKGELTDYLSLKEYYLRPPKADKNKKLLEAMEHE